MLSLLIGPDHDLDEASQPQTRQSRREIIREKERDAANRKKLNQAQAQPRDESKKGRKKTARLDKQRKAQLQRVSFADHCYHVAEMIVKTAKDLEGLANEEQQWFEGYDGLVDTLARQHQVVDKYRSVYSPTSKYERRVIAGALAICELDKLIDIEKKMGWWRLRAINNPIYRYTTITRLRAA